MPHYRRYLLEGRVVFVTLVTHHRRPWLGETARVETLLESMKRVKAHRPFRHIAHVVLPDHMHWMFRPADDDFSKIVGAVKRDVSWRLKEAGRILPPYWQSRFYDHIIRDEADLRRHLDYIHFNPVRHGVAPSAAAYIYSSFGAWRDRGVYDDGWGDAEPRGLSEMDLE
jgi:putative transposase